MVLFQGFPWTLLQDLFFIFQQTRGLSLYTSPCGECTDSLFTLFLSYAGDYIQSQLCRGLLLFLQDTDTRFILHLISCSGTTVCTLHLEVHVLVLYDALAAPSLSLNAFALLW